MNKNIIKGVTKIRGLENNKIKIKNILWNTIGSIFYCICQWLITIIVVHISSYKNAGYLSLAMTTSSSFSAISLFSMRNFQISDVKEEYTTENYVGSRIITCIVAFFCCVIISYWNSSMYQLLCTVAFMLIRIAEAIVDVLHGVDQKYEKYDYIGVSYILRGSSTVILFIIGFFITNDLRYTLFIIAFLNLFIAILFDWKKTYSLEKFFPKILSYKVLILLKTCVPIVIFSFLLSIENLIPKIILQQQFSTKELGIYSTIASPTLIVQVFASVAFNPFIPKLSILYNSKNIKYFRKRIYLIYILLFGMIMIVLLGANIFGKIGLKLLFNNEILKYYYLFMPIVWCTILTAIIWVLSAILVLIRKIRWLLIGMLINFITCIILVVPCINRFEKNGVSLIQIFTYVTHIIFMILVLEISMYEKRKRESD